MKKTVGLLLLATVLCCLLGVYASAYNLNATYAEAYYNVLSKASQGIMDDADYYNMYSDKISRTARTEKILYAHLIDITGDGIEELFLKEHIKHDSTAMLDGSYCEWIRIFTVENGKLKRIGQTLDWAKKSADGKGYSFYEPVGYIGSVITYYNMYQDSEDFIYLCTSSNGKKYICDTIPYKNFDNTVSFYGYNGSVMEKCDRFNSMFVPDWRVGSITSSYGRYTHEINGNKVSESEYSRRFDKYIKGGYIPIENNDYTVVFNELKKMGIGKFIPSSWAQEAVNAAKSEGYLPANLTNKFDSPITRAEFCDLATAFYEKYFGTIDKGDVKFTDTTNVNVEKMASLGVVSGVGNGKFNPSGTLTREMAATILVRLGEKIGILFSTQDGTYDDAWDMSSWATANISKASKAGLMGGVGNNRFSPKGFYTREQSITTMLRLKNIFVPVKEIKMADERTIWAHEGAAPCPEYEIIPSNASEKALVWSSSNENICKVNASTGELTPVSAGTVTITATCKAGVSGKYKLTVAEDIELKTPKFIIKNLPLTIDATEYDRFDDETNVIGKITVKNVEARTEYIKSCDDYEVEFKVKATRKMYDEYDYYGYFPQALGFKIFDAEGNLIKDDSFVIGFESGEKSSEGSWDKALFCFSPSSSFNPGIKHYSTYYVEFYDAWAD